MPETISEAIPAACVEAICEVWDRLDDQLCSDESNLVQLHIDECAYCRGFERFQGSLRTLVTGRTHDRNDIARMVKARLRCELDRASRLFDTMRYAGRTTPGRWRR